MSNIKDKHIDVIITGKSKKWQNGDNFFLK